jgi:hypothetical protein
MSTSHIERPTDPSEAIFVLIRNGDYGSSLLPMSELAAKGDEAAGRYLQFMNEGPVEEHAQHTTIASP